MADVFISHSSIDKELADKVCETLEARGLKCWIAPRDIMPGSEWAVAISNAISVVRAMVVIYSKNSAQSTQVPKEIALAEKRGKFILPYKIDDTELEGAFDYYLTGAHWIVANPEKGDYKLEEMYGVIAGVLQMPAQNITNNLYIDNVTIHSSNVASGSDDVKENKTKKEAPKNESEKEKVTLRPEAKKNRGGKKWILLAVILLVVLLGVAIVLFVMLGKTDGDDEDDWTEYEDEDDGEEDDPEEDDPEGYDPEEDDPEGYDPEVDDPEEDEPYIFDEDALFEENFIYEFEGDSIVITGYVGAEQYVVIPEEVYGTYVTEIDDFAFYGTDVISVAIPEGVTRIGYSAFLECTELVEVTLPESLITIEGWAFAKTALEELWIPYGIKRVEEFAFQDSENMVLHCWGESYTYEELAGFYIDEEE